ncbi:hypothetical protein D3C76_1734280 [compost metagenome]
MPTDFGFMACIIAHSFKDAGYLDSETIFSIILSKLSILLHPQHYIIYIGIQNIHELLITSNCKAPDGVSKASNT